LVKTYKDFFDKPKNEDHVSCPSYPVEKKKGNTKSLYGASSQLFQFPGPGRKIYMTTRTLLCLVLRSTRFQSLYGVGNWNFSKSQRLSRGAWNVSKSHNLYRKGRLAIFFLNPKAYIEVEISVGWNRPFMHHYTTRLVLGWCEGNVHLAKGKLCPEIYFTLLSLLRKADTALGAIV